MIQFSILLIYTVPCSKWLSKQNRGSLLSAHPTVQSSRGKAVTHLQKKACVLQADMVDEKKDHITGVTAGTQKRWMMGGGGWFKFPGPSKMSNIDSFVT